MVADATDFSGATFRYLMCGGAVLHIQIYYILHYPHVGNKYYVVKGVRTV